MKGIKKDTEQDKDKTNCVHYEPKHFSVRSHLSQSQWSFQLEEREPPKFKVSRKKFRAQAKAKIQIVFYCIWRILSSLS